MVEARHRMSESPRTWEELCAVASLESNGQAPDSPVQRLATGGQVVSTSALNNPEPACATGSCCPGGMCGLG
ncbi:MAG: zinc ribbon domain-containing protein [Pseudomonadota bacterium]|nr:zinc ribbon domain-containing protein [Pseudomonadota bacterium]